MPNKALILSGLLLAGCNMAPKAVQTEWPTAPTYIDNQGQSDAGGVAATSVDYGTYYPDSRLRGLIEMGLRQNRDLAVAVAQIAEARAAYRIQGSERLPGLGGTAGVTRSKMSGNDSMGFSYEGTSHNVGVALPAFELDFWGRVRNLTDAARAQYLATEYGARAARLAIIRSIATSYWLARETDERIALAEATVSSRQEGLRIAKRRLDAGVTSALDYRQAESLLTQAETELAGLKLARSQARNQLSVLVGGPLPDNQPAALPLSAQMPTRVLAAGLPSDLLRNRPDILAAEEQLKAARANIGAARAAFFPNISLTGNFGFASRELENLFSSGSTAWSVGPSLNLPIFDWGRRKGNLDVAVARQDIAVANYEKTIQEAFREVSDALAGRKYLAEEVAAQERATSSAREIARLAQIRYREGVANYLEVLDAERNLFGAEQALLSLRRQELTNLAALYAALGGGLFPQD